MFFYREIAPTVFNTNDDVQNFIDSGITNIQGDLIIGGSVTSVILDNLQTIKGQIKIVNTSLQQISISSLTTVGSILIADNNSLTSVSFPNLTTINGSLTIDNNISLVSVELGAFN